MDELSAARGRLRRLERRLELLLLGGLKDGLQDPSAANLVNAICEQKSTVEKMEEAIVADKEAKSGDQSQT
jgi:hypothetical protein